MKFTLINPYIEGSKISSNKKDLNLAAEDIWSNISTKVKNYIPEFYFSVQDLSDKSIHHLKVNESLENREVKYSIDVLKGGKYHDNDKYLLTEIKNLKKMNGGKHKHHKHDSSSSSSSSSSDEIVYNLGKNSTTTLFTPFRTPLSLTYYPSIYGVNNILLPSFVSSFTPFIKINFPLTSQVIIT